MTRKLAPKKWRKISDGFVEQEFEGEVCVSQKFTAGDVDFELDSGENIEPPADYEYQPFHMILVNPEYLITMLKEAGSRNAQEVIADAIQMLEGKVPELSKRP